MPYNSVQMPKCLTSKWRCNQALLDQEIDRQSVSIPCSSKLQFDGESELAFAIKASGSPKFLDTDDAPRELLGSTDQIVTTALIRFLEFRG